VTAPFFAITGDGFGPANSSEALLINTSPKSQEIQVTFTPKGRDNSVIPGYGKTLTIKVPPTPFTISPSNKTKLHIGDVMTINIKSVWPITSLLAPLRKYPEVELRVYKLNKNNVYTILDVPEFKTDNTFTFTIPKDLGVYKNNKLGQLEKSGVESVIPGKYRLSLKTAFGSGYYDFVVEK
jgi:hypothetical protein